MVTPTYTLTHKHRQTYIHRHRHTDIQRHETRRELIGRGKKRVSGNGRKKVMEGKYDENACMKLSENQRNPCFKNVDHWLKKNRNFCIGIFREKTNPVLHMGTKQK